MGWFYFDETIQERGGFIIGAFVYSEYDITPIVFQALTDAGLQPGLNEFKSGAQMTAHPEQVHLRGLLSALLLNVRVGLVVAPSTERHQLGYEALSGLRKIILANSLDKTSHQVFFDEGIAIDAASANAFLRSLPSACQLKMDQDSRLIGGIQIADLAAHTLGVMLLEQLGLVSKTVRTGEGSGYDPDMEISIGFELWASLRYSFFRDPTPKPVSNPDGIVGDAIFDVENFGLHIASACAPHLRASALKRFGECYLGCIH